MKIFIYTLANPVTNEIRYVGKTINLQKRYTEHITNKKKTHCKSWIKSLLNLNIFPKMEILDEIDNDNWEQLEQYWISQLLQWGFNLTNHTSGGQGRHNSIVSKETREKMASRRTGKKLSDESKAKISQKNKGKVRNQDNRDRISNSLKELYNNNPHPLKGIKKGTCNNKLIPEQVLEIRKLILEGNSSLKISLIFKVSKATIQQIREGRTWQSLGEFKIPKKWKVPKKNIDLV